MYGDEALAGIGAGVIGTVFRACRRRCIVRRYWLKAMTRHTRIITQTIATQIPARIASPELAPFGSFASVMAGWQGVATARLAC